MQAVGHRGSHHTVPCYSDNDQTFLPISRETNPMLNVHPARDSYELHDVSPRISAILDGACLGEISPLPNEAMHGSHHRRLLLFFVEWYPGSNFPIGGRTRIPCARLPYDSKHEGPRRQSKWIQ